MVVSIVKQLLNFDLCVQFAILMYMIYIMIGTFSHYDVNEMYRVAILSLLCIPLAVGALILAYFLDKMILVKIEAIIILSLLFSFYILVKKS